MMVERKEQILNATINVFHKKGLKFTMDDIASELAISKKTIYTVFRDKQSLFLQMVDYCFDKIKESELEILNNPDLSTIDKLRQVLVVIPDGYKDIDFRQLYSLRERYPKIYKKVEERLETGWEPTLELINKGIEEGCIKPVNVQVLKTMVQATLEQFIQRDVLIKNQIDYMEALDEIVKIIFEGIEVK
ncbi:MAG: TetR/AcrR family transcriptional regulator [Agathobacter sp.]|nr:TetR/AcrR family transcriptional regulator [Agathobacter sp.]